MTNLEALQSTVAPEVKAGVLERILLNRGLEKTGPYTPGLSAFELANADLLVHLVTFANVSEGGYSISISEKESLKKLADSIYTKHGEPSPFTPTIRDASNRW